MKIKDSKKEKPREVIFTLFDGAVCPKCGVEGKVFHGPGFDVHCRSCGKNYDSRDVKESWCTKKK